MANAGDVKIQVKLDLGSANRDIKKLISIIDKMEKSGKTDLNSLSKELTELENDFKKTANASKQMESASSKQGKGIKNLGANIGGYVMAAQAAIGAIRGMVSVTQDFIKEADNHDMAQGKLTQGLQNVNDYSKENVALLNQQSMALSKLTGFQSDEITHAQGMLTTFGQTSEQIEMLTPRILDMAASLKKAGKETDAQQIAIALGKATTMGAGALSRYGVKMTDAQKKQLRLAKGMEKTKLIAEILDANFSGMAESTATNSGRMVSRWNDFQVAIGGILQEVQGYFLDGFLPVLEDVVDWITRNKNTIVKVIKVVVEFLKMSFMSAIAPIRFFVKTWIDSVDILGRGSVVFIDTLQSLRKIVTTTFKTMLDSAKNFGKIIGYILTGQFGKAKDAVVELKDGLVDGFSDIGREFSGTMDKNRAFFQESSRKIGENAREAFIDPFRNGVSNIANIVTDVATIEGKKIGKTVGDSAGNEMAKALAEKMREASTGLSVDAAISQREKVKTFSEPLRTVTMDTEELDIKPKSINIEDMQDGMTSLYNTMSEFAVEVGGLFDSTIGNAFDGLIEGGMKLEDIMKNLMKDLTKMAFMAGFKVLFGGLTGGAATTVSGLFGLSGGTGVATRGFASGTGSFTVPDGFPADSFKIGLTSGEVVKVGNSDSDMGGGGITNNINVQGVFSTDRQRMARYVDRSLRLAQQDSKIFDKG